jgi:hypothetical protein
VRKILTILLLFMAAAGVCFANSFRSQLVPGLSLKYPDNWEVRETVVKDEEDSQGSYVSILIAPYSASQQSLDLSPCTYSIKVEHRFPGPPQVGAVELRIPSVGLDFAVRDQERFVMKSSPFEGPKDNWPFDTYRDITFKFLGKDLVGSKLSGPGKVSESVYSVSPPVVACASAPNFDKGAATTFPVLRQVLESLTLPDSAFVSPLKKQSLFVRSCGLSYICVVLSTIAVFVIGTTVPPRLRNRYRILAGAALFLIGYAQMLLAYICLVYFVPVSIASALHGLALAMAYSPGQEHLLEAESFLMIVGTLASGVAVLSLLYAQVRGVFAKHGRYIICDSRHHTALWRRLNSMVESRGAPPFSSIAISVVPCLHIENKLVGGSRLYVGIPFLDGLDDDTLVPMIAHEAAHNDQGNLLFYPIAENVAARMRRQSETLKEVAGMWSRAFARPNFQYPAAPLLGGGVFSLLMCGNVLIATVLDYLRRVLITPLKWTFEFDCDRAAVRASGERRFSRSLLCAAVIQTCWKEALASPQTVAAVADNYDTLYAKLWVRACDKVLESLEERVRCEGHPPLCDRLSIVGTPIRSQRVIIGNIKKSGLSPGHLSKNEVALWRALSKVPASGRNGWNPNYRRQIQRIASAGLVSFLD